MSQTVEIMIGICALILAIILTRRFHYWKTKRSYLLIVDDLKSQGAYAPDTAVELPYARQFAIRFGFRDHRPMAINHLLIENIVAKTDDGRYYLLDKTI